MHRNMIRRIFAKIPIAWPVSARSHHRAPFGPRIQAAGQPAGTWAVETYRFDTAVVAACQGERVVLKIFGVNGKEHVTTVPDFGKNFTIRRGQMSTVVFRVPKTGIFPIICVTHRPSHTADLVVLPC